MKRRVLTVTLALLLAVLGTGAVLAYVHGANARAVAGAKAVPVLVAQQPIPAGTSASAALHEGLLASQQLPASSVPSNAVSAITPRSQLAGHERQRCSPVSCCCARCW